MSAGADHARAAGTDRRRAVLGRIRSVPEGYVTTYGDVSPSAPRFAGTVLAAADERVPWHRVVRSDGTLAQGRRQRELLEAEGVPFRGERVDLRQALIPPEALRPD